VFVAGTHMSHGDKVAATDFCTPLQICREVGTTPGILIRSDSVFYWKADARTEIPVSLCAHDATTRFMSDKWTRQRSRCAQDRSVGNEIRSGVDNPSIVDTTRLQSISLH